jgi:hypothetical protein
MWSGDKWTAGLITHLLELMHRMWKHHNSILHTVDTQGLPLQQTADLEASIHSKFCKGTEGLARKDYHFICQGWDVFSMSVINKQVRMASQYSTGLWISSNSSSSTSTAATVNDQFFPDDWWLSIINTWATIPSSLSKVRIWSYSLTLEVTPSHGWLFQRRSSEQYYLRFAPFYHPSSV